MYDVGPRVDCVFLLLLFLDEAAFLVSTPLFYFSFVIKDYLWIHFFQTKLTSINNSVVLGRQPFNLPFFPLA